MGDIKYFDTDHDRSEMAAASVTVTDDQWIPIPHGVLFHSCCDCRLSHYIEIRGEGADREIRFKGDPELTERHRALLQEDGST